MDPELLLLRVAQFGRLLQRSWQVGPWRQQPMLPSKRPTSTAGLPIGLDESMPMQLFRLPKHHAIGGEQHTIEGLMHLSSRAGGDQQIGTISHHRNRRQGHQPGRWCDAAGFDQAAGGGPFDGLGGLTMQHPQAAFTAQRDPGDRERETKGERWQRPHVRTHG
tara:strand:- start:1168 stop:1656 length:489 start_codon:yes stop_codon:yes gene_type:complete